MRYLIKKRKNTIGKRHFWLYALPVCIVVGIIGAYFVLSSHATIVNWQPVYDANFADPSAISYNGKYYGFATQSSGHIPSASSVDSFNWSKGPDAVPKLPSWASSGPNWAPDVTYDAASGRFVMFFAAIDKSNSKHCISRAFSSTPQGPYVDSSTSPFLCQPDLGGTIDPDLFQDSDGNYYLYVKNAGGVGHTYSALWVQPLTTSLDPSGPLTMLLKADQSWQGGVIEGPSMLKLGANYYLFYAGNDWNSSRYAIGYATCPSPTDPCTEGPANPVLSTSGKMVGPGSPDFFTNASGAQAMVFHAWVSTVGSHRAMYEASVALNGGRPTLTPASSSPTPIVGDINADGRVDLTDLSTLLNDWGTSNSAADLNNDGKVNLTDFSILLSNWTV